mgnify:CR=1 FL=1
MSVFAYKGYSRTGRAIKGVIEAESKRFAVSKLKKDGIIPFSIKEKKTDKKTSFGISFGSFITRKDIAVFSRQISAMLRSGVPLAEALDAIIKQTQKVSMKGVISELADGIKEGKSFAQVLSEKPRIFPEIYVGMIRAGEASGNLENIVEDLAEYVESQIALRSKVISASIYPVLVLLVMAGVVTLLMTFVIPKIAKILEGVGQGLPFYTSALISVSKFVSAVMPYFLIFLFISLIIRKKVLSIKKVKITIDKIKMKLPIFSRIHLQLAYFRIFSTLATLTKAGVPLIKSLDICSSLSGNEFLKNAILDSKNNIIEGGSMYDSLLKSGLFPPMIIHMVAVGERSGELENMFQHISNTLKSEIETTVTALTSLLEPILVVAMGGLVFFIMLSILIPIMQINRTIM